MIVSHTRLYVVATARTASRPYFLSKMTNASFFTISIISNTCNNPLPNAVGLTVHPANAFTVSIFSHCPSDQSLKSHLLFLSFVESGHSAMICVMAGEAVRAMEVRFSVLS